MILRKGVRLIVMLSIMLTASLYTSLGLAQGLQVTIQELSDFPVEHLEKEVVVRGKLEKIRRSRRLAVQFIITDHKGIHVSINPWRPIFPPTPAEPGSKKKNGRFITMSNYIGKTLELRGVFRANEPKSSRFRDKYYLKVISAKEIK